MVGHEAECLDNGVASSVDGSVGAAVGVHEGRARLVREVLHLRKLPKTTSLGVLLM